MKLNSSFWKMSSLKDLDGLHSLLKDCFFFFHDSWYQNRWGKCDKRRLSAFVPKKTPLNTHVFTSVFICAVRLIVMQFNNGSVNSKHAYPASSFGHLLGICLFFLVWKAANAPLWGRAAHTKTPLRGFKYANALPRDVTKIAFSSKKSCKCYMNRKSVLNNLIKTRKEPFTNRF